MVTTVSTPTLDAPTGERGPSRDAAEPIATAWPRWTCVAFRFFFLVTLLYSLVVLWSELLWRLPLPLAIGNAWNALIDPWWRPFARFVAARVLGLVVLNPQRVQLVGFGCVLVSAALGTILWSAADRRRHYDVLFAWLRVYCRYCAAVFLISYGLSKVFLNQADFPPTPSALLRPMGAFNPQDFFFAYLGVSPFYQVFAGVVELSAGILLILRSTAAIGALLAIAAMANVVVVNWAFQIPMYRISLTTFVFAVFLLLPEMPRLLDVLIWNRPTVPLDHRRLFHHVSANRIASAIGVCFLVVELVFLSNRTITEGSHSRGRPPLYGAYVVETYERTRASASAGLNPNPWTQFAVDSKASGSRIAADAIGTIVRLRDTIPVMIRSDTAAHTLTFVRSSNPKQASKWSYVSPDTNHLVLNGVDEAGHPDRSTRQSDRPAAGSQPAGDPGAHDSVRIVLRRLDLLKLTLLRSR